MSHPKRMLWIGHLRDRDNNSIASFAVDERDYRDHAAAEAMLCEARRELARRNMGLELEGVQVPADGPRYPLPTWQEFAPTLPDPAET